MLQVLSLEEWERLGVRTIFLKGGRVESQLSKLMVQLTEAMSEIEGVKVTGRDKRRKFYRVTRATTLGG